MALSTNKSSTGSFSSSDKKTLLPFSLTTRLKKKKKLPLILGAMLHQKYFFLLSHKPIELVLPILSICVI